MAKELGFYKKAGIDLKITEYSSNTNIIEEVRNGNKDFGIWGAGVVENAMKGKPIVLLANYFKRSPLAIITQPEIVLPSELKNKKLMIPTSDLDSANYQQMFKIFNLDYNDINYVPSSFNIQDFIDKKVDAYSSFLTNEPYILRKKGVRHNILDPNNYGIEMYDVNLFSSKKFVKNNPELIKKFIEASNKGWKYALENKEKTVDLILKKYNSQNKTKEHLLFEANETVRMMLPQIYPIGSIDINKLEKMGNLFIELGMTKYFDDYNSIIFQAIKPSISLTKQELNYIQKNRVIPISVMEDFSPFSFKLDGKYQGFVNDTLDILESKTGLKFKRVTGQWVKNLNRFKSKETKIIADISYKPERESFTLFTKPYYEIPTLVFVRDDFKDYKGIESFKGNKVGIQKDIFYAKEVANIEGIDLVVNESIEEMAKNLSFGKIDIAIMNLLTMNHYIKKLGLVNIQAIDELILPTVSREDLRFGINTDQPLLYSIINKGMEAISNKEWLTLTNKWIGLNASTQFKNEKKSENSTILNKDEKNYLKNKKLKLCIAPNWFPIEGLNDKNEHVGMGADIKNIIASKLNKDITIVKTDSFSNTLKSAKEKKCNLVSLVKSTSDRKKYLNFTKTLYNIPYVVVTKKDKFFINDFKEIEKNIFAVVKDYAIESDLKKFYPNTKIKTVKSVEEGLKLVQENKVYGYIDAIPAIGYIIDKNEMYDLKIVGKLPMGYDLSYGVDKDDLKLLNIINKTIEEINSEEKNRIYRKWIAVQQEKVVDYKLIWQIVIIASLLILMISYWSSKLLKAKNEIEKTNKLLEQAKNEIEKKNKELNITVDTDNLTKLLSRRKIDGILENEINRCERFNHTFTVTILDIDYFKAVNDTYGHNIGDEVLIEFANVLKSQIRKTDFVGRWGGEEFVIVLPETNKESAVILLEKIRQEIESHTFKTVKTKTASFGVSQFQKGDTVNTIIKRADNALYEAKNQGRNRVVQ